MRAIVLSGGGAKGAYQVGVWKALRKLGIKYDIVTGTSIGSVNGLMMVQNDFWKTLWLWSNISFDVLYDVPFPKKYSTLLEKTEIYKNYAKHFFQNGGISMGKMEKLLSKAYNEKQFKKSNINYGLVTYNLTKMEPLFITKDAMGNKVIDYVLASSCCFPAFQPKEIDKEQFVDGGYYDNLPINLAIELGAREIIAIDLEAIGIKKTIEDDTVKVKYIKPRNDIGPFLVFDKKLAMRGIKFGYFDTLKEYRQLDGNKYTFKYGNLNKNYERYSRKFLEYVDYIFKCDEGIYTDLLKLSFFSRILKTRKEYELKKIFNETIEFLGTLFEVEACHLYTIKKFNSILIKQNNKKEEISKQFIEKKLKQKAFKELLNTSYIVKYLYNVLNKDISHKDLCALASIFPKEFVGAIYLKIIK